MRWESVWPFRFSDFGGHILCRHVATHPNELGSGLCVSYFLSILSDLLSREKSMQQKAEQFWKTSIIKWQKFTVIQKTAFGKITVSQSYISQVV